MLSFLCTYCASFLRVEQVKLTGLVKLVRSPTTGLITSYREYWDQSVGEVLKTARI